MHAITEAEIKSSPPMKAALVDFYESYLVEPNPVVWIWMLMNTRDYPHIPGKGDNTCIAFKFNNFISILLVYLVP